jgi:PAS domain S-box-containing protein
MDAQQQDSWSMEPQPDGFLGVLGRVPVTQFLRIVMPLTLVMALAFVLKFRSEVAADEERLFAREANAIERGIRQIEGELEIAARDLFFVGSLVKVALEDSPEDHSGLEQNLLALAQSRPDYKQLSFIDAAGKERIRVENLEAGARLAPEGGLRDDSERDYFVHTSRLGAGEIFSAMDPDNPKGPRKGELTKPVIRLTTPVDGASGERLGIVALDARGPAILGEFELGANEGGVQRMIVNSAGYWARSGPEVEGFMLAHGKGFQSTLPEVWRQIVEMGKGRVESSDGLFYFDTFGRLAASVGADTKGLGGSSWVLISAVPRATLHATDIRVATRLLVIAVPVLFAILTVGWLLAASRERRRLHKRALRNAHSVRSAIMTAALDAIVVMDANGIALEFNPTAQRIFGYTPDEIRGRQVADLIIPPDRREDHRQGLERFLETREGRFIDKHIGNLTGMRKDGSEFSVELTICPVHAAGRQLFFGFLRDLSEPGRTEIEAAA